MLLLLSDVSGAGANRPIQNQPSVADTKPAGGSFLGRAANFLGIGGKSGLSAGDSLSANAGGGVPLLDRDIQLSVDEVAALKALITDIAGQDPEGLVNELKKLSTKDGVINPVKVQLFVVALREKLAQPSISASSLADGVEINDAQSDFLFKFNELVGGAISVLSEEFPSLPDTAATAATGPKGMQSKTLTPLQTLLNNAKATIDNLGKAGADLTSKEVDAAAQSLGEAQAYLKAHKSEVAQLARAGKDTKVAEKALAGMEKSLASMQHDVSALARHVVTVEEMGKYIAPRQVAQEQAQAAYDGELNKLQTLRTDLNALNPGSDDHKVKSSAIGASQDRLGVLSEKLEKATADLRVATKEFQNAQKAVDPTLARLKFALGDYIGDFKSVVSLVKNNLELFKDEQKSKARWDAFKGFVAAAGTVVGVVGAGAAAVAAVLATGGIALPFIIAGGALFGGLGIASSVKLFQKISSFWDAKTEHKQLERDIANFQTSLLNELDRAEHMDAAYLPIGELMQGYSDFVADGELPVNSATMRPEIAARVLIYSGRNQASELLQKMPKAEAHAVLAAMNQQDALAVKDLLLRMPASKAAEILNAGSDTQFAAAALTFMHDSKQAAAAGMILVALKDSFGADKAAGGAAIDGMTRFMSEPVRKAMITEVNLPLHARLMGLDPVSAAKVMNDLDVETATKALAQMPIKYSAAILGEMDVDAAVEVAKHFLSLGGGGRAMLATIFTQMRPEAVARILLAMDDAGKSVKILNVLSPEVGSRILSRMDKGSQIDILDRMFLGDMANTGPLLSRVGTDVAATALMVNGGAYIKDCATLLANMKPGRAAGILVAMHGLINVDEERTHTQKAGEILHAMGALKSEVNPGYEAQRAIVGQLPEGPKEAILAAAKAAEEAALQAANSEAPEVIFSVRNLHLNASKLLPTEDLGSDISPSSFSPDPSASSRVGAISMSVDINIEEADLSTVLENHKSFTKSRLSGASNVSLFQGDRNAVESTHAALVAYRNNPNQDNYTSLIGALRADPRRGTEELFNLAMTFLAGAFITHAQETMLSNFAKMVEGENWVDMSSGQLQEKYVDWGRQLLNDTLKDDVPGLINTLAAACGASVKLNPQNKEAADAIIYPWVGEWLYNAFATAQTV